MEYRSYYELPKVILCGVSKKVLKGFISLLYCGEVNLNRPESENLIALLKRLDVDTKHFSSSGFLIQSQTDLNEKEIEYKTTNFQEAKLETDSLDEKEVGLSDDYEDDINKDEDSDMEEEDAAKLATDSVGELDVGNEDDEEVYKIEKGSAPEKISFVKKNWNDLKAEQKKKIEEEIKQGLRYPSGGKKKTFVAKAKKGQYVCPECGISVTLKRTLKNHIDTIHKGIRYQCDQCTFQGKTRQRLRLHIESVHEGKRYFCDQCEYAALNKANLRTHINNVHCERNYVCDQCDYKAKTAAILQAHINAIHLKIKLTCPECGSKHSQQGHLVKHRKKKHGYKSMEYFTKKRLAEDSKI